AQRRIPLERARVERLAHDALVRHFRLLGERATLRAPPGVDGHAPAADRLLAGLLDDKLAQSLERAFRLLAIAHPREDFRRLRHACSSSDPYMRATAGELLDALMRHRDQQPLRALLRLITEDLPPSERAARAVPLTGRPMPGGRAEALAALMHDHDPVVARLATVCAKGTAASASAPRAM